jgi:hypothetical protein
MPPDNQYTSGYYSTTMSPLSSTPSKKNPKRKAPPAAPKNKRKPPTSLERAVKRGSAVREGPIVHNAREQGGQKADTGNLKKARAKTQIVGENGNTRNRSSQATHGCQDTWHPEFYPGSAG